MANEFNRSSVIQGRTVADAAIDEGLRSYMLRVYNYMTTGLALTGIVAYLVSSTPALLQLFYAQNSLGQVQPTILAYVAMFSPLAFVLVLSFGIQRMRASTAQLVFWLFAGVMGLSMSHIFLTFTGASIARVFFISAATFAAMSLYGYTTKRDLSGLGSFLMMGLVGVILASIVNVHRLDRDAVRDLGHWCSGFRGPHSLRHPEDQGDVQRARRLRSCRQESQIGRAHV